MKNRNIFTSMMIAIAIMAVFSCSNDINVQTLNSTIIEETNSSGQDAVSSFISSVEEINKQYSQSLFRTRGPKDNIEQSRDISDQKEFISKADTYGGKFGAWAGKHAGSALGASTGNPLLAVGGYLAGRIAGQVVGHVAASFIAAKFVNHAVKNNYEAVLRKSVNGQLTREDSIGYIHNAIMSKMIAQGNKYATASGGLDYDLIYNDCLLYLKEYGIYDEEFAKNKNAKDSIIMSSKEIASFVKMAVNKEITDEEFDTKCVGYIQSTFGLSESQKDLMLYYENIVLDNCLNLSFDEKENYLTDIDKAIKESEFNEFQKAQISTTTQIIFNSTEYWGKNAYTIDKIK